jgi:hypothetical protein
MARLSALVEFRQKLVKKYCPIEINDAKVVDPSLSRSIVDAIEVDDKAIRIIGNKDVLQAVIAGKQNANGNVRGFVRKWRTRHESNV